MPLRLREQRQGRRKDQCERKDHDDCIVRCADRAVYGGFVKEPDGDHQ